MDDAREIRMMSATCFATIGAALAAMMLAAPVSHAQQSPACDNGLRGELRVQRGSPAVNLGNVPITARWQESRGGTATQTRTASARTTGDGAFTLCGLPAAGVVIVRALTATGRVEPLRVRLTAGAPPPPAMLVVDGTRRPVASLVGSVVRIDSLRHLPLSDVEVTIPTLGLSARTDTAGRFALAGIAPGTHRVIARRIGSGSVTEDVEFGPNDEVEWHVPLLRLTTLSEVNVVARRIDHALLEFEEHRRIGLGKFITRDEILRFEGMKPVTVIRRLASVRVLGNSNNSYVMSARALQPTQCRTPPRNKAVQMAQPGGSGVYEPTASEAARGIKCGCYAQVYLDGMLMNPGKPADPFDINSIPMTQIEAVEWYAGPSQTPVQYANLNSTCGVLVFHSRRPEGAPATPPPAAPPPAAPRPTGSPPPG